MKKIGVLVFIIIMMTVATAAQADVRAGGLPAVAGVSSDTAFTQAGPRAGTLPAITMDEKIPNCACKTDLSSCPKPVVAAPEPAPVVVSSPVSEPAPAPMKEKVTISLDVQFDNNKAVVKEKYHDDIKRVADFMKEFPDTTAAIEGHTDNVSGAVYNQKLSEKRANSVRKYIIDKFGIDGSRLTAAGYGLAKPIASNDTEEGRQKNRRVEAVMESIRTVK